MDADEVDGNETRRFGVYFDMRRALDQHLWSLRTTKGRCRRKEGNDKTQDLHRGEPGLEGKENICNHARGVIEPQIVMDSVNCLSCKPVTEENTKNILSLLLAKESASNLHNMFLTYFRLLNNRRIYLLGEEETKTRIEKSSFTYITSVLSNSFSCFVHFFFFGDVNFVTETRAASSSHQFNSLINS